MRSSTAIILLLVGMLSLIGTLDGGKARKVKKPKSIDWNHTYYSTKFGICKKLRSFNPVELMRAQAWAADVFRKCAPKIVIAYATKSNFPAFGIERVVQLLCYAANFGYAFFSPTGTLTIENDVRTKQFFQLAVKVYQALSAANHNFTVRYRGEVLFISVDCMASFTFALLKCVFDEEFVTQTDGDVVKHALEHAKIMIL